MSIDKMVQKIKEFERDYIGISAEKTQCLSLVILAISRGDANILRAFAEEIDVKKALLERGSLLTISDIAKVELKETLIEAIQELSYGEFTDYIMLHAKVLELYTDVELANRIIELSAFASKMRMSVPQQITEIVSMYFGECSNSSIYTYSSGVGLEVADLYRRNPSVEIYMQQLNVNSGLIAELFFYIKKEKINISYGDLISQPGFLEGNHLQKFEFVYMVPPFGMKATAEQEAMIEDDQYGRFNYFGRPSKLHLDLGYLVSGLSALSENGKAVFLLPVGALFRSGMDQKIRERLLYADVIEAVIELPTGLLSPYTGIATALVLVNKNKMAERKNKVMMMNLREFGKSERRNVKLSNEAFNVIEQGIHEFLEVASVTSVMGVNDFKDMNLVPSNYLYEAKMEFDEFGTVQFDLAAFEQLNTKPLRKVAKTYRGYNALPRNLDENGAYAVLKIADVEDGEINYNELSYYNVEERTKVDNYRIRKGDVLLSIRGQSLKVAVFDEERDDVLLSQNFVGIRCGQELDPHFLKLYFESPTVQFIFKSKLTGSTVMNLPIKEVEEIKIPVLPLKQQEEIVQSYMIQRKQIQEKLKELQKELNQLKLDSFEAMGISSTFMIQD